MRFLRLLACQLLLLFACAHAQAADTVEVTHAHIEATEDGYKLDAKFAFDLNHGLEDAIQHGVKMFFTTSVEITRYRWYWRDEVISSTRQTARIYYDPLVRQYQVKIMDTLIQQNYNTLEEALFMIRRPGRWVIAPKGSMKPGETYTVTIKMGMDRDYLNKPLQVNALNNAEWRLSSNKKTFQYKAE